MKYFVKKNKGFTLVELIVYLGITTMLLTLIGSFIINVYNAKKMLQSSDLVDHNARFILNYLANRIHNVDTLVGTGATPADLLFYVSSTSRFSITLENNNIVYRQSDDLGAGFPDQSSVTPIILNTNDITVSNLILQTLEDDQGVANKGTSLGFTLTTTGTVDPYRSLQQSYKTFISIR